MVSDSILWEVLSSPQVALPSVGEDCTLIEGGLDPRDSFSLLEEVRIYEGRSSVVEVECLYIIYE
jgi:hypothetical protein